LHFSKNGLAIDFKRIVFGEKRVQTAGAMFFLRQRSRGRLRPGTGCYEVGQNGLQVNIRNSLSWIL